MHKDITPDGERLGAMSVSTVILILISLVQGVGVFYDEEIVRS